jgi:peptidoglycan/LPS O-acetylase OafA/YrhL
VTPPRSSQGPILPAFPPVGVSERVAAVPSDDKKKVAALHFGYADGLRALAVLYVFVYHTMIVAPSFGHSIRLCDLVLVFQPVDMFFILSAFLLSGPFIRSYLHDGRDFPLIGGYALARIYRCFPVYYVGITTITLFLCLVHTPPTVWDVVTHALFIEDFFPATTQSLSGPLWTLAVDVQFYIALPILFWYLYKATRSKTYAQRVPILYWTLAALTVACVVYRYVVQVTVTPNSWEAQIVWLHQLPGMTCVLTTGTAARAFLETASTKLRERVVSPFWWLIGGAFLIHIPDWAYDAHYDLMLGLHVGSFNIGAPLFAMNDLIDAVGCVMVVLALAGSPANPVSRVLSGQFFARASTLSFAFYIFHETVLRAIVGQKPQPSWPLFFGSFALTFAILIPICILEYRFVETPFLKIKSTVKRSKQTHVPDWSDVQKMGAKVVDARLFPGTSEQA